MVEWVAPVLPANRPQTEAEAAAGRAAGRKLPTPEILQPVLDSALQPYQPRADRKLMDRYEAAGVDRVMLGLPSADAATVLRKLDDHVKLAGL